MSEHGLETGQVLDEIPFGVWVARATGEVLY
jgi:hypothetical protein